MLSRYFLLGISYSGKIVFLIGVILVLFGTINLIVDRLALAETLTSEDASNEYTPTSLADVIILRLIAEVGPIMGGLVAIGINFARKQGLKISADAEEYLVNSTKSFVQNQSRMIYQEIKKNPQYLNNLKQGTIPPELKTKALQNVKEQLLVEIESDEFTKTAKQMLKDNMEPLIERYVTEHKLDQSEKTKTMLTQLIPVAVDAALLPFKSKEEARGSVDKIIQEVLKAVETSFDYENILFSNDVATMHIKSELNKRLGSITHT